MAYLKGPITLMYNVNGILALNPYYLGPCTLRGILTVAYLKGPITIIYNVNGILALKLYFGSLDP